MNPLIVATAARSGIATLNALGSALAGSAPDPAAKPDPSTGPLQQAKAAAEDFEAVFLNQMLSQMFTGIDGEGPFGGGAGTEIWRSFLSEEYAKSFARTGGIGIADHVYPVLLAQQEAPPA